MVLCCCQCHQLFPWTAEANVSPQSWPYLSSERPLFCNFSPIFFQAPLAVLHISSSPHHCIVQFLKFFSCLSILTPQVMASIFLVLIITYCWLQIFLFTSDSDIPLPTDTSTCLYLRFSKFLFFSPHPALPITLTMMTTPSLQLHRSKLMKVFLHLFLSDPSHPIHQQVPFNLLFKYQNSTMWPLTTALTTDPGHHHLSPGLL